MASSQENGSCNGCATDCPTSSAPIIDIEDYQLELKNLRQRTKELEAVISSLGINASSDGATNGASSSSSSSSSSTTTPRLRSTRWFKDKDDVSMSAVYIDRFLTFGMTRQELMSGKPVIGIAQTGSDLAPCNRHHLELSKRIREGIRTAGGIAFEFPTHPIQETTRRPTATLDRNLMYLGLVEILHAYPIDGVVLLTGCDKTTPACLMAAATFNIPAICMNVGPMLNGYTIKDGKEELIGSGTGFFKARQLHEAGLIDDETLVDRVTSATPSVGHCNTMGTASTMNAMAEALGMALPGSAAIPAAYRKRAQCAYQTGQQIVEMVRADRKPSDIMTREAFENAIVVNTAIGGSTNAPIHLNAVAKHIGVPLNLDDWDKIGFNLPLLVNVQPAGQMLCENYFRAGGLPAVMAELLDQGKLHANALTCNGKSIGENVKGQNSWDRETIRPYSKPLKTDAGFVHLTGNLFNSAIMKTSVISDEFRKEFLEDPKDPNAFECKVAVFDGREDFYKRIENSEKLVDRRTILVMRGAGPIGYPGAAEVVNMHAPGHLVRQGVQSLPCIGDGRQSGTSGSPSILNASPEAAAGGNLAILHDGDILRVDLNNRRVDILVPDEELKKRREELEAKGGYQYPESQTPWQEIFRREAGQLDEGMVLQTAVKYQRIAQKNPAPRHNH